MAKQFLEADFDTKESAEEFKKYLADEMNTRKRIRNLDKKRRPSSISGPNVEEYRKLTGEVGIVAKDAAAIACDANMYFHLNQGESSFNRYVYFKKSDRPGLSKYGESQINEYKKFLDTQGINAKLETRKGEPSRLSVQFSELTPRELDVLVAELNPYSNGYGTATIDARVRHFFIVPLSYRTAVKDVPVLDRTVRFERKGQVYAKGYRFEAEIQGRRGAVKNLAREAEVKAEALGRTKYSVRKK